MEGGAPFAQSRVVRYGLATDLESELRSVRHTPSRKGQLLRNSSSGSFSVSQVVGAAKEGGDRDHADRTAPQSQVSGDETGSLLPIVSFHGHLNLSKVGASVFW